MIKVKFIPENKIIEVNAKTVGQLIKRLNLNDEEVLVIEPKTKRLLTPDVRLFDGFEIVILKIL